ncbi:MAG TPA: hydroxymethylbilane synthase, partial [Candidatus Bathyarchaeia archaeon]|nr:hydroxymethylbilane synthase [Candidatus Bathyarchaeia archaeon]
GIFEKEINQAVISGQVDFAVHSLKDIPSDLSDKLIVASIPKRASPNDVLVSKEKLKLEELSNSSIVGTSSLRRAIQIFRLRQDLHVKPIRGNVETRIRRLGVGEYDGVILAEAGLIRLGMKDVIAERFDFEDFVPAPGQGAIAIVCRRQNAELIELLKTAEDPESKVEVDAERALVSKLQAGCRFPVGAIAVSKPSQSTFTLYASIFSPDGRKNIKLKKSGNVRHPVQVGIELADLLLKEGAKELAVGWRNAVEDWNKKL